jgi:hypothetical protein
VAAINPDGTQNTTFSAPTISQVIATSGAYKITFPADAVNKLFTLTNEYNPYTILVKGTITGSTYYREIRVYCVDRLPGEIALASEVNTNTGNIQTAVDALPTLAQIEATTVLAKDATVAKAATVALEATLAGKPTLAQIEATTVLAKEASLTAKPTLAQIEASTILAKEATIALVKKFIKNKKVLTESGGVYSLIIYDDNDIDEILRKTIKDIAGADISAVAAGVIAREAKSSV